MARFNVWCVLHDGVIGCKTVEDVVTPEEAVDLVVAADRDEDQIAYVSDVVRLDDNA